jgi:hypothetical protein
MPRASSRPSRALRGRTAEAAKRAVGAGTPVAARIRSKAALGETYLLGTSLTMMRNWSRLPSHV